MRRGLGSRVFGHGGGPRVVAPLSNGVYIGGLYWDNGKENGNDYLGCKV